MTSNQSLVWLIAKAVRLFQGQLDQQRNSASTQVDWMVAQQLQQLHSINRSSGNWNKRPATNIIINQCMLASNQRQQMVLKI